MFSSDLHSKYTSPLGSCHPPGSRHEGMGSCQGSSHDNCLCGGGDSPPLAPRGGKGVVDLGPLGKWGGGGREITASFLQEIGLSLSPRSFAALEISLSPFLPRRVGCIPELSPRGSDEVWGACVPVGDLFEFGLGGPPCPGLWTSRGGQ